MTLTLARQRNEREASAPIPLWMEEIERNRQLDREKMISGDKKSKLVIYLSNSCFYFHYYNL